MADSYWKKAERQVGEILGGKRNTHDKGSNVPDVEHDWLAPEVKSRKEVPGWLIEALMQAEANAEKCKLPIDCIMERGKRGGKSDEQAGMHLAVIRLETFRDWFVK